MDCQHSDNQANALLQNGILVATNKGVVCMSLTDALTSNLNLSVEDFQAVAQQLILQEEIIKTDFEDSSEVQQIPSNATIDSYAQIIKNEFEQSSPYSSEVLQTSSDTTIDSDEQTHDNRITIVKSSTIQTNTVADVVKEKTIKLSGPIENQTVSDSDTNSITAVIYNNTNVTMQAVSPLIETNKVPAKRRGGWPKGRKRKPELLHLPPKAPATGYNLYLNDMRKQFKNSALAFHEITKIIGNKWSSLSLEQKQPYLERAEEDKRRYREELRIYRQSGAYQLYLAKKRKKRVQNNVLSESDMDATDDIDDEDNEELYCRTCDQWFHNLHNKREHLQGRQHVQAMVGDMRSELGASVSFSTSIDESSLDAIPGTTIAGSNSKNVDEMSVSECMANLLTSVTKREKEIKTLKMRLEEANAAHDALYQQLHLLKERETTLRNELNRLHNVDRKIEIQLFQLWKVPSLFISTELNSGSLDGSEYLTDE